MSRTIVVFELPTKQLAYTELTDLAGKPAQGSFFMLEGVRYSVQSVTEPLGVFDQQGQRRDGMSKLLEMLAWTFGNDTVNVLKTLRNIGSGDQPEVGPGGIVLPPKNLIPDFDHLVYVKLASERGRAVTPDLIGQIVKAVASGTGNAEEIVAKQSGAETGAAPRITVGDAAAE